MWHWLDSYVRLFLSKWEARICCSAFQTSMTIGKSLATQVVACLWLVWASVGSFWAFKNSAEPFVSHHTHRPTDGGDGVCVCVCRGFSSNGSFLRSIWRVLILTEGYFPEWVIIRRHGLLLSLRSTWITFLITGESERVIIKSRAPHGRFLMAVIHDVLFFNQCEPNVWERK